MLVQDYRIIKQIRDQFFTSNYLLDSIMSLNLIYNSFLPEDTFLDDLPFSYIMEQELINLNLKTYNFYKESVDKIIESMKKMVNSEKYEEMEEKILSEKEKNQKKEEK